MSNSVGEGHSAVANQLPTVTIQSEQSVVQGRNNEDSTGESHCVQQVDNLVGWTVYKMYGMREVKGVVESYNSETNIYDVRYKDGKTEKVTHDSLVRYMSPCKPEDEQPSGAKSLRINAQNPAKIPRARKVTKRKRSGGGAGAAPAQRSRQGPGGSNTSEVPAGNSGGRKKEPYRSLRMNAGNAGR